jgi:hypothetical protein
LPNFLMQEGMEKGSIERLQHIEITELLSEKSPHARLDRPFASGYAVMALMGMQISRMRQIPATSRKTCSPSWRFVAWEALRGPEASESKGV